MSEREERYIRAALIGGLLFVVAVAFGIALLGSPARGHSFYDTYCCSGQDCEPIADARVRIISGGYMIDARWFVPEAQARESPDGRYHLCLWPNPDTLRCFYRPSMGS